VNPPPHSLLAAREIVDYVERLHAEGRDDEIPREIVRLRGVLLDLEEELGAGPGDCHSDCHGLLPSP
jgi:hypothetical protein